MWEFDLYGKVGERGGAPCITHHALHDAPDLVIFHACIKWECNRDRGGATKTEVCMILSIFDMAGFGLGYNGIME